MRINKWLVLFSLCASLAHAAIIMPYVPSAQETADALSDLGFGGGTVVSPGTNGVPVTNTASVTVWEEGPNIAIEQTIVGSTSIVNISASSAIAGPQGPAGAGNLLNYGAWSTNGYSSNSLVQYGGSTYYSRYGVTNGVSPNNDTTNWAVFAAAGTSGTSGTNGINGSGLFYLGAWNGGALTTNNIVSYQGTSYVPNRNLTPTSDDPSTSTNYTVFAAAGSSGANGSIGSNLFFAGSWTGGTAYPSNAVVTYGGQAWYANSNITTTLYVAPGTHAGWTLWIASGANGTSGTDGSDGISMVYDSCYDAGKTYVSNTVVHYPCSGKKNLYRALTTTAGATPNISPASWEEILSSGTDAQVTQWVFSDSYSGSTTYSNALVLYGGATYYTKQVTVGNTPAVGAYWGLLVTNGTAGANGTNGVNGANGATNMTFRGTWTGGTYLTNDLVTHSGVSYYVSIATTTARPPATGWSIFVDRGPEGPASTNYINYITNEVSYTYLTNNVYTTNVVNTTNIQNNSNYYTSYVTVVTNTYTATNAITRFQAVGSNVNFIGNNPTNADVANYCVTNGSSGGSGGGGAYIQTGTNNIVPTNGLNAVESDATNSVVLGGNSNFVKTGRGNFVGGGERNVITNGSGGFASSHNFLGGGLDNTIYNWLSTYPAGVLVGGYNNSLWSGYSFLGGGYGNGIDSSSEYAGLVSGNGNYIYGVGSFIGAGALNSIGGAAVASYAVVAGGYDNDLATAASYSTIGGGYDNDIGASATYATVGGGNNNDVSNSTTYATIAGGQYNRAGATHAAIAGGYGNSIQGTAIYSGIGGGYFNRIYGNSVASFAAGDDNAISNARGSIAFGELSRVDHPHSFVFNDNYTNELHTTAAAQFLIKAAGGLWLNDSTVLTVVSGTRFVTNVDPKAYTPVRQGVLMYDVGSNLTYLAEAATTNDWVKSAVWTAAP